MSSSPVLAIAAHEFRLAWRSWAVAAFAAVLTVLMLVAALVGDARAAAEASQRRRYQTVVGQQFAGQPDRHPHRVSHYGYLLFRPQAPLGFFDSGVEGFAGTSLFLEAHRQNTANFSAAVQSSERFGELTLATVLQLFLPLFIFATAGVSIAREREAGTLPLVMVQGTSWPVLLWGKAAGMLLVVLAVVVPGLLGSMGWVAWRAHTAWDGDLVARAAALLAVHAGFLATCIVLAVVVSAWQHTSRGALVVLVGLWFTLWIVVPRALPALATALYPEPSRAAFDAEVEARLAELGDTHNPDDPTFARLRDEALRRYGVSRVEDLPFNYSGLVMKQGEIATSTAIGERIDRLQSVYRRQTRLIEAAALVSPYLAVRVASMALAGSDLAHMLEFERQAEAFRFALIQALNDLHIEQVTRAQDRYGAVVNGAPTRQRIDAAFFDHLPAFDYQQPRIAWAVRQQWLGTCCGLLGCAAALFLMAWTGRHHGRAT